MPRPTVPTPAQQNRDAGLSRLRRLTWWTAIGATGLTAVASLIAANTNPGRPAAQAPTAPAASTANSGVSGSGSGSGQGAVNPPAQAPQPNLGNNGPVAVSGGS